MSSVTALEVPFSTSLPSLRTEVSLSTMFWDVVHYETSSVVQEGLLLLILPHIVDHTFMAFRVPLQTL